ncbi:MAG: S8 family peptidase [Phenylobacterium sp.]|jgi:subtilisin family serine protease|uniref:S8 family peptidase n=1 Tax=Phenylobacterium sp. TaxID=1871053 RepID=UPI002A35D549|nr:S8 family peptidase [Phenylobacterium sp.]MDX9999592.1 S8 family peptidase [Phenylobacterium sp.]
MAEHDDNLEKKRRLEEIFAPYVVSPVLVRRYQEAAEAGGDRALRVILDLNLNHPDGRDGAKDKLSRLMGDMGGGLAERADFEASRHHVFVRLTLEELQALVAADHGGRGGPPGIYKVWLDRPLEPFLDRSMRIIKADVCHKSFAADGEGIVWAVADSGIEGDHPHFSTFDTLKPPQSGPAPAASTLQTQVRLEHRDFTDAGSPLTDGFGHGTHVAGIIAGATPFQVRNGTARVKKPGAVRVRTERDAHDRIQSRAEALKTPLQGVAPRCKLISLKVLDDAGEGYESQLLAALDYVARVNDDGRWLRIHGVNLSLGYSFEAEWFAAGQSPICVAVDRLVATGVVVVAAAGNDGSVKIVPDMARGEKRVGLDQSINDPGNAERAITVGSTHPVAPHTYGVSFFSSRGPTADGRPKPDLVAPGERILSCASRRTVDALLEANPELEGSFDPASGAAFYREESGTSMAAPHVSGAIAAFLSIRSEFRGKPDRIKEILLESATDLKRKRDFQGAGLLDLFRALQSV